MRGPKHKRGRIVIDLVTTLYGDENQEVRVLHVPSAHQFADIMTKGLPVQLFTEFRSSLCVRTPPAATAGGY
jgi:hypothetical protein